MVTPYFLDRPSPAVASLARPGWCVNDSARPSGGDQLDHMSAIHRSLAVEVERAARRGDRPVSIGGDCCAAIPVVAGLQRAGVSPLLVWLDAHGDFNTHESTLSGFIGGMPLAMLTGRGDPTLVQASGVSPLADDRVILADARDLDPPERELLDRSQVTRVSDVGRLADLVAGKAIHVHLDVDILDAAEAPAMLYPVAGGPSVDALCRAAEQLRARATVVAVSITPWLIDRDQDGSTARAGWKVIEALAGC